MAKLIGSLDDAPDFMPRRTKGEPEEEDFMKKKLKQMQKMEENRKLENQKIYDMSQQMAERNQISKKSGPAKAENEEDMIFKDKTQQ